MSLRGDGKGVTRNAVRQVHPEEEAAAGPSPPGFTRKHCLQRVEHRIATSLVECSPFYYVRLEVEFSIANEVHDRLLQQRIGMKIDAALGP